LWRRKKTKEKFNIKMMGAQTEHKKSGEGGCEERRGQVEKGSKI
jgi:hypothetical protein